MRLTNHTPFPALAFESLAPDGSAFTTLVLKATFDIRPDGSRRVADEQTPLTLADDYYGDPLTTSVRLESDLAPFKPRADILFLDPVAHSPGGKPARAWTVSVRVGELRHQLRVTGPRRWVRGLFGGCSLAGGPGSLHSESTVVAVSPRITILEVLNHADAARVSELAVALSDR